MVNITIDNQKISVPSGTTIMEAATKLGTPIPKLCYLKDINEIAACRVCVVEIEGKDRLVTSTRTARRYALQEDRLYSLSFPSMTANVQPVSEAGTVHFSRLQMI